MYAHTVIFVQVYFRFIQGPYSLSVRDLDDQRDAHVKHYNIRSLDAKQGYYIAARRVFKTLEELVKHYSGILRQFLFIYIDTNLPIELT
ncbi:unnamed protein product [Didymodactylos carnosus]|uniref:SH2 domain-containing protein n=1 Tax=Didymodactylos carnosus TaxID=1234261 RepID=A0A815V537_9BILA|nr:unnamed protein product [Didymodactylos carnosus]CAF4382441.1 unnamed protein product [Didymodactylos carnosus]